MATLESLKQRINTTKNLRDVVSSMKTLSAASIHQYEKASKALIEYGQTIEDGLRVVLKHKKKLPTSSTSQNAIAIIIGSDQGLVGRFNKSVIDFALTKLKEHNIHKEQTRFIAVGRSLNTKLSATNQKAEHLFTLPGSIKGITPLTQSIVLKTDEIRTHTKAGHVFLFYNAKTAQAAADPQMNKLLPIDAQFFKTLMEKPWPTNQRPLCRGDLDKVFNNLVQQLLFMNIYKAITRSLASEHLSRMMSMQAAEKNIDEHLGKMNQEYQQTRQQQITEEILDVISGAEVLHQEQKKQQKAG